MEQVILKIYEPYTAKWSLNRRLLNGLVRVAKKDITYTPMSELEMTFKIQEELGRTWKTERIKENHGSN